MFGSESGEVRAVSGEQFVQRHVVRDVGRPAVGGGHGGVELRVRVVEPLWPGVVEVGQGPLLERGCSLLVTRYRPRRIAGNRFIDPLHPLGRVEPAVTEFDEPPSRGSDGLRAWVRGIVGRGHVG